jgi:hypothetical protein
MFWIGLFIALMSGLAPTGAVRSLASKRYRGLKDLHLDIIGAALLLVGLGLAAYDHVPADKELERLEALASPPMLSYASHETKVRSGLIETTVTFQLSKPGPLGPLHFRIVVSPAAEIAEFKPAVLAMDVRSQIDGGRRAASLQFATAGGAAPALKVVVTAPTTISLEEGHLLKPIIIGTR